MKLKLFYLCLCLLLLSYCGGGLKIASAEKGGTYHQIGTSLEDLGVSLENMATAGTQANLELLKNGKVDLAIVQADLWEDAAFSNVDVRQKIKLVLPLFKEEIHLVANKTILSLAGLKGKKVSIGSQSSGTAATSKALLGFFNLKIQDMHTLNLKSEKSIEQLMNGEIDAAFLIAGAPFKLLSELPQTAAEKIHIISIDAGALQNIQKFLSYYKPATIDAKTYGWQPQAVKTLSVQSVIVGNVAANTQEIKKLIQGVKSKRAQLNQAHTKWQSIELNYKEYDSSSIHPAAQ